MDIIGVLNQIETQIETDVKGQKLNKFAPAEVEEAGLLPWSPQPLLRCGILHSIHLQILDILIYTKKFYEIIDLFAFDKIINISIKLIIMSSCEYRRGCKEDKQLQ